LTRKGKKPPSGGFLLANLADMVSASLSYEEARFIGFTPIFTHAISDSWVCLFLSPQLDL
jgi:hypothetical protein